MGTVTALRKIFRKREDRQSPAPRDLLADCSKDQIEKILYYSEAETLLKAFPVCAGKNVILIRNSQHQYLSHKFASMNTGCFNDVIFQTHPRQALSEIKESNTILCDRDKLPLKNNWADVAVFTLATEKNTDYKTNIQQLARVVKNGGRAVIAFCHPQYEKYTADNNQNAASHNCIMNYFQELKKNQLFTEDLLEGRIDLSLKACFIDENLKDHYPSVENHPVTLVIRAVKFVRGK